MSPSGKNQYRVKIKTFTKEVTKMTDKEQIVLDAMRKAGKSVRPGDIARMTGLDSKEVSKLISNLKKEGRLFSPKRCFYAPVE